MRVSEAEFAAMQLARQTPTEKAEREASERQQAIDLAEAEIEKDILDFLRYMSIPHTQSKAELARRSAEKIRDGWPDITGCYRGRLLAIEVKAATGTLRKSQIKTLSELWAAGALVVIARSVQDVQTAVRDEKHDESAVELSHAMLRLKATA